MFSLTASMHHYVYTSPGNISKVPRLGKIAVR